MINKYLLAVVTLIFVLPACGDSDNNLFGPPDYSSVPDLPDTSSAEKVTLGEGLEYYVIEEGSGPISLQSRDQATVYITFRREDGTVISSSYANGSQSPITISVPIYGTSAAIGFRMAVEGMKIGERRVIFISPEWAYGKVSETHQYYSLRNDRISYDVKLEAVF